MDYDIIIMMTVFMVATSITGAVFTYGKKNVDGALASYFFAGLSSFLLLLLDAVPSNRLHPFFTFLDAFYVLVMLVMLIKSYGRYTEVQERAEEERKILARLSPYAKVIDTNERRGTFLVRLNSSSGRYPSDVEAFFADDEYVTVICIDCYAAVKVVDPHPNQYNMGAGDIYWRLKSLMEELTKERESDQKHRQDAHNYAWHEMEVRRPLRWGED